MKRSEALLLNLALSLSYLVSSIALRAQAFNETQNSFFPIDLFIFIPCAADGQGEVVELTGELHDLFHITGDAAGGFFVKDQDNPQGVNGTGQTTGDKYQGTRVTRNEFTTEPGFQNTFVNNFRIIGEGPGNDFLIQEDKIEDFKNRLYNLSDVQAMKSFLEIVEDRGWRPYVS